MIFDAIENAERYYGLGDKFQKAFDFLKNADFSSIDKDLIEIDGKNIYAMIQKYDTRSVSENRIENGEKK